MTDFKEGEIVYAIHPIITEYITEPFGDSFCFREVKEEIIRSGEVFKTKNEAIDDLIKKLEEI